MEEKSDKMVNDPIDEAKADPGESIASADTDEKKEDNYKAINIKQSNRRKGGDGNQENNIDFRFRRIIAENFSVTIDQGRKEQAALLQFSHLEKPAAKSILSEDTLNYVEACVPDVIKEIKESRIAVVNCHHRGSGIELEVVQRLVCSKGFVYDKKPLCCVLPLKEATLENIIFQIKQDSVFSKKKNNDKVLVIFEKKDNSSELLDSDLLQSVSKDKGVLMHLSSSLRSAGVFIFYVCNNSSLLKSSPVKERGFPVLNISIERELLFKRLPHNQAFRDAARVVEAALYEYGWLAKSSSAERMIQLEKLIDAGTLIDEMSKIIEKTDLVETGEIMELLKSPVHNIVLFVATFLEETRMDEFDEVISLLVRYEDKSKHQLEEEWEKNNYEILAKCGIVQVVIKAGFVTYKFESVSRQKNTREIFTNHLGLKFHKRYLLLAQNFIIAPQWVSLRLFKNVADLAFISARLDINRSLTGVAMELAEQLSDEEVSGDKLRILSYRLLYIINTWKSKEEFREFLEQFFHWMRETPARRAILGVILIHICKPNQPENLASLRSLLNSSGKNEDVILYTTAALIADNYAEHFDELLNAVEGWQTGNESNTISRAFVYAKSSLLQLFYERRFQPADKGKVAWKLMEDLSKNATDEKIKIFASFIYYKGIEVFEMTIWDEVEDQYKRSNLEKKMLYSHWQLFIACILAECYYLIECINEADPSMSGSGRDVVKKMIQFMTVADSTIRSSLTVAFRRLATAYNIEIKGLGVIGERNKRKKEALVRKRSLARTLETITDISS